MLMSRNSPPLSSWISTLILLCCIISLSLTVSIDIESELTNNLSNLLNTKENTFSKEAEEKRVKKLLEPMFDLQKQTKMYVLKIKFDNYKLLTKLSNKSYGPSEEDKQQMEDLEPQLSEEALIEQDRKEEVIFK